jgi:hypothetical protein
VCTEARIIFRVVAANFSLTIGVWRSLQITTFGMNQSTSLLCAELKVGRIA